MSCLIGKNVLLAIIADGLLSTDVVRYRLETCFLFFPDCFGIPRIQ